MGSSGIHGGGSYTLCWPESSSILRSPPHSAHRTPSILNTDSWVLSLPHRAMPTQLSSPATMSAITSAREPSPISSSQTPKRRILGRCSIERTIPILHVRHAELDVRYNAAFRSAVHGAGDAELRAS